MRVAELQREAADLADVHVVRVAVAVAVVIEFAVFDEDVAPGICAGEDAILIVVETAIAHDEPPAFLADSGAVAIRDAAAGEFDVLDGGIVTADDPDRFLLRALSICREMGHAVHAADGEVVCGPDGDVAWIIAGVDPDGVAILRGGGSGTWDLILLSGANAEQPTCGGFGGLRTRYLPQKQTADAGCEDE